jgi:hypothetical protein
MTSGFKTILLIAIAAIGALAVGIHLFAPELMRTLGQALHGGR